MSQNTEVMMSTSGSQESGVGGTVGSSAVRFCVSCLSLCIHQNGTESLFGKAQPRCSFLQRREVTLIHSDPQQLDEALQRISTSGCQHRLSGCAWNKCCQLHNLFSVLEFGTCAMYVFVWFYARHAHIRSAERIIGVKCWDQKEKKSQIPSWTWPITQILILIMYTCMLIMCIYTSTHRHTNAKAAQLTMCGTVVMQSIPALWMAPTLPQYK